MKVLIDLQSCQAPGSRYRGIGRYSMSLAQAMVAEQPTHEYWLLLNAAFTVSVKEISAQFSGSIPSERIATFFPTLGCAEANSDSTWLTRVAELNRLAVIRKIDPDVVHTSSLFEGLTDDCVVSVSDLLTKYVDVVTVYDLIPFRHADRYLTQARVKNYYMRKLDALGRADLLLCISKYTACEVVAQLPAVSIDRVVNISSAVDDSFGAPTLGGDASAHDTLVAHSIFKPFIMYTGGIDWRKNIEGLITAFALLPGSVRSAHQLVLVCKIEAGTKKTLRKLCSSLHLRIGEVVFTGFVTDEELTNLYKSCSLFVFPSLHEGFGLPVLEAMKCGATVIGSNTSSIPEVICNPDALFNPDYPSEIAKLMGRVLTDAPFKRKLREHAIVQAAQFSWKKTAATALQAMQQTHDRHQKTYAALVSAADTTAALSKPTLAMLTPMPPSRSGIADYSCELLTALKTHYQITVISQAELPETEPRDGIAIQTVDWFEQHADSFERIVYQFGNSHFHAHMFRLLAEHPGVVVLHDFFLSGVLDWMELRADMPGEFGNALARSHGKVGLQFEQDYGRARTIEKYPCNSFVVDRAKGVIVHSTHSVALAKSFYGENAAEGWKVIPLLRTLPAQSNRQNARKSLGIQPDEILVCSFGHLSASKLNDRLLYAWASSSLSTNSKCRLVFVGENAPGAYGKSVERLIEKAGTARRIQLTGFTTNELFETYLAAADFAVQLRGQSRGETSKAVVDCLAHGLSVIVNANGSMADYPDDAVCKLPDNFDDQALIGALELLSHSGAERKRLASGGLDLVRTLHDPATIALQYKTAIEAFSKAATQSNYWTLLDDIAGLDGHSDMTAHIEAATSVAKNIPLI